MVAVPIQATVASIVEVGLPACPRTQATLCRATPSQRVVRRPTTNVRIVLRNTTDRMPCTITFDRCTWTRWKSITVRTARSIMLGIKHCVNTCATYTASQRMWSPSWFRPRNSNSWRAWTCERACVPRSRSILQSILLLFLFAPFLTRVHMPSELISSYTYILDRLSMICSDGYLYYYLHCPLPFPGLTYSSPHFIPGFFTFHTFSVFFFFVLIFLNQTHTHSLTSALSTWRRIFNTECSFLNDTIESNQTRTLVPGSFPTPT